MIVDTMTHEEVFQELEHDRDALTRWVDRQYDSNRRRALKTRRFPAAWWMEWTSPRRIKYIILVRVGKRRYDGNYTYTTLALRRGADGYTAYLTGVDDASGVTPAALIPHVFKRYAERCGVDKGGGGAYPQVRGAQPCQQ